MSMPGLFGVDTGANANEHRNELTIWRIFNCLEMANEKKNQALDAALSLCASTFIMIHRYSGYRRAACVVKLA